jgi:hypothetical protein
VFRPTLKPKRKPEKNLKFGEDYQVSVSAQWEKAETHFFRRLALQFW